MILEQLSSVRTLNLVRVQMCKEQIYLMKKLPFLEHLKLDKVEIEGGFGKLLEMCNKLKKYLFSVYGTTSDGCKIPIIRGCFILWAAPLI